MAERITILRKSNRKAANGSYYRVCRCSCGKEFELANSHLKTQKSCGCLMAKGNSSTHRDSKSPTYITWDAMKTRCNNPNASNFGAYGGRGIKICKEWFDYKQFKSDMGERPKDTSIDRIDVNGNYEKSNCRWATMLEQRHNRRNT